jgi:purine-cytosine permease-like protein
MNIVVRWWLVVLLTIFVLRTVLVSRFGLDVPEIFWLWKEAVIFLLFICSVYVLFRRREIPDHGRWILSGGVVLLTVRSLYLAMVVHGQSLGDRAVFAKYDLMGRGVLLA